MTILDQILKDVREGVASAKLNRSVAELCSMTADAPPVRSFGQALADTFGLIAEIKERSPSVGPMRPENVREAPLAYEKSHVVRAVSILTNKPYFGMSIEQLGKIRETVSKPVLRKDFIVDEYQIREARAFGADAILLMANVLDQSRLRGFYEFALELGMEALFEIHTAEEIEFIPPHARIIGINSRNFKTNRGFVGASGMSATDFSVNLSVFDLREKIASEKLCVAESGLSPASIDQVRTKFAAALVGTSLLREKRGIHAILKEFEGAIDTSDNKRSIASEL